MIESLPTWNDCEKAVKDGRATTLEGFIYDNEPAGSDAKGWRHDLLRMLQVEFVKAEALVTRRMRDIQNGFSNG